MSFNTLKILSLSAVLAISLLASAQKKDSIKTIRNVQIEREYTPEVTPIDRPNINLQAEDPKIQKANPIFSDYIKLYDIKASPLIPLQPKQFNSINRRHGKSGFARLGFGPLFGWLGDFWYPVWNTGDGYFDILFHHDGILSISDNNKKLFNTALGINFNTNFDDSQLYISAMIANKSFNYYGKDEDIQTYNAHKDWNNIFTKDQSFNTIDLMLGLKNKERNSSDLFWDAYLNYHLHTTSVKVAEHNVNAIGKIDLQLDDNSLIAEGGAKVFFYNNRDNEAMTAIPYIYGIDNAKWKTNVIMYLTPAFWWDFDNVKIKLGAKSFFSFGRTPAIALSPDVRIDYFADDILNLYAGVGGDYSVNSLANTTALNRYYNLSATLHNTYTPFDLYGGLNVKIVKGLIFNALASYKYVFNAIFFKNNAFKFGANDTCYNRYFEANYQNGGRFNAKLGLNYNIQERINLFASMEYNRWFFKKETNVNYYAWHTPEWLINVGSDFKVGKGFFGGLHFYFASKMKAEKFAFDATTNTKQEIVTLPATYDLNLNAGYNISKNLSIFGQLNNILAISPDMNPQIWYGYKTMGFNALIGFTLQF